MRVVATVESTYQIQTFVAAVETLSTNLTFSQCAYYGKNYQCHPGYTGNLDLSGLTRGTHVVTATATDVFGGSGQAQRAFVYDRLPTVLVAEPESESVARPDVHLVVQCTDDDPNGCVSISVLAENYGNTVLTGGTGGNLDTG